MWAFAQLVFSILVYLESDWRFICAGFIGIPMLSTLIPMHLYLLETPRYLVSQRRFIEAHATLNFIATTNRRPPLKSRLMGEMDDVNQQVTLIFQKRNTDKNEEQNKNFGYIDLFRFSSLRNMTLCMIFIWFFRYFAYYGLNFSLSSLGEEIYLNFIVIAMAEIIAYGLAGNYNLLS